MKFDKRKLYTRSYAHVYFYRDVTPESIQELQVTLLEQTKPTVLHISSMGGYVDAMKPIYNTLSYLKVPVCTLVEGHCASAATVIALATEQRFATNYSLTLLHQYSIQAEYPLEGRFTTRHELLYNMDVLESAEQFSTDIYESKLSLTRREIDALLKTDRYLSSAECLKMGFYTELVDLEKDGIKAKRGVKKSKDIKTLLKKTAPASSWIYVVHEPVKKLLKRFTYTDREFTSSKVIMLVLPPLENIELNYLLPLCAQLAHLPNKVYAVVNNDSLLTTLMLSLFCDHSYILSNVKVQCGYKNLEGGWSRISSEDALKNRAALGELLRQIASVRRGAVAAAFVSKVFAKDLHQVDASAFVEAGLINELITV